MKSTRDGAQREIDAARIAFRLFGSVGSSDVDYESDPPRRIAAALIQKGRTLPIVGSLLRIKVLLNFAS